MNLGRYAKSMLGIMLLVCPVTSFPVDIKPTAVTPVGAYARIKATADHTYGHEMRLWQSGNRLIGQVLYWDGMPHTALFAVTINQHFPGFALKFSGYLPA